jgi:hypothetical protein
VIDDAMFTTVQSFDGIGKHFCVHGDTAWKYFLDLYIVYHIYQILKAWKFLKQNKLRGLSPQANYPDRATAAVAEVVPTFADRGVLRGQRNGSPRPLISVF